MKKGEKGILIGIGLFAVIAMGFKAYNVANQTEKDPGIPFYTTSNKEIQSAATKLIRKQDCRNCHVLWGKRTIMQSVPAPSLDGLGSLHSEQWFYDYLSAENPQSIVATRLKEEFRMPSFAALEESDRRLLAQYLASLKVEDWYLEETKKAEYEKLTGKKYQP